MTTLQRWSALWQRLNARSAPMPVFDELTQAYNQPHRAYHTLDHIRDCLAQFDLVRHFAQFPDEVEFAVWCHDVIYDPHTANNEAQSAAWTTRVLREAAVADEVIVRVTALILATQHHSLPDDPDAALMVDIDLSILGRPAAEFDRYEAAIRQEYQWVPEMAYRQARLRILAGFAARPAIYQTALFQERYEAQARLNLARSIQQLHEGEDTP